MGRPWKYDRLIQNLDDDDLYFTAKVIAYGLSEGLFDFSFDDPDRKLNDIEKKNAMANARSSLSHFVGKYLPEDPDGYLPGSKPTRVKYPAWYGWRWKRQQEKTLNRDR